MTYFKTSITTHSTHSIYGYMASEGMSEACDLHKEGNILFNDSLNTFYLRLCGVGYVVKDHTGTSRVLEV